jgi:hypothetical protein
MVTDLFLLKSSEMFNILKDQAVRLDLGLTTPSSPPEGGLSGKVTHCGRPIPNATVVLLDAQLDPVTFTQTDQAGIYCITGLSSRRYGQTATGTDFLPADIIFFFLPENEIRIANIELKRQNRVFFMGCGSARSNEVSNNYVGSHGTLKVFYDKVTAP